MTSTARTHAAARCAARSPRPAGTATTGSLVTAPLSAGRSVPSIRPPRAAGDVHTGPGRQTRRHFGPWLALVAALLFACGVLDVASENHVDVLDPLALAVAVGRDLGAVRWQYAAAVVALAAAHYGASAVAARAASGLPLPLGQTVLVQLAASAANRLTPFGAGGAAVNSRYFAKRGHDPVAAIAAAVVLTAVGAAADLAALAVIVLCGPWIGLRGATQGMSSLASQASGLVHPLQSLWTWAALTLVLAAAAAVPAARHRLRRLGALLLPLQQLLSDRARLATVGVASASTTVLLGVAFIASAAMVGGAQPGQPLGAQLVGYMIAGAAGGAIPIPAGIGTTEVMLTAVLVADGMPGTHAAEAVIIFRIITFWLPPLAGVAATRHLRRVGAL